MEKDHLEKLIANYLSGKSTPEEDLELRAWYASFEKDPGITDKLTDPEKQALERMLLNRIDERIRVMEYETMRSEGRLRSLSKHNVKRAVSESWYKVAAVVTGLLVAAVIGYYSFEQRPVVHTTEYGETASIALPDGSRVILNGHSTLRYVDNWTEEEVREVHLDGEAFFSVAPTSTKQKFIVNISETMSVEVLGTKFNVSKRKSGTRVVLNSGKVLLNLKEPEGVEPVMMSPGELVEFKGDNPADYVKKKVNVEIYSAWKNRKLIFDHTSLSQVMVMLEESYGLKSHVTDRGLLGLQVSGTIPAEDVESLLKNISVTYGITIEREGSSLIIKRASRLN